MKLSELFRQLSYGELKNHAMSSAKGQIAPDSQPELVIYVNDGLERLHSRFVLKEKALLLEQVSGVTHYHLTRAHTQSAWLSANGANIDGDSDLTVDPNAPPDLTQWDSLPYIKDMLGEPFQEDVIKILEVYDGHIYGSAYGGGLRSPYEMADCSGDIATELDCFYPFLGAFRGDNYSNTLPLNDSEDMFSLFTPQSNVLQVPHPRHGWALGVKYQAGHPVLQDNDLSQVVELPKVLEGALKAFIAHKVFSYMNGQDNEISAQKHLANYESICTDVVDKDLVSTSQSSTNIRFHKRGFV